MSRAERKPLRCLSVEPSLLQLPRWILVPTHIELGSLPCLSVCIKCYHLCSARGTVGDAGNPISKGL